MKIIACILLFITVVSVTAAEKDAHDIVLSKYMNAPVKELFKVYHLLFKKDYSLDSEEALTRYAVFKQNMKFIKEENAKDHSYQLGIGPWTDLTNEEYRQRVLSSSEDLLGDLMEREETSANNRATRSYTPKSLIINWSESLTPVRTQDLCVASGAFSAVGAIEANFNKNNKLKLVLSPQEIVDCDVASLGCKGGPATAALEFAKLNGIAAESSYTFKSGKTGEPGKCRMNEIMPIRVLSDYTACKQSPCNIDEWLAMLKTGPIVVHIDAQAPEFQHYTSGILNPDPQQCSTFNLFVVAFGFLYDKEGDYVLLRNSWSSKWGEKGNVKVRYNAKAAKCNGSSLAWQPIIRPFGSDSSDVDPTPPVPIDPEGQTCVSFYKECNYVTLASGGCISNPDLTTSKNQDIFGSAKKVTLDSEVLMFTDTQCRGQALPLTSDDVCFAKSTVVSHFRANKKVRSFSLVQAKDLPKDNCIAVYTANCYSGKKYEICNDTANLNDLKIDNLSVSIKFGKNVKGITVFIDANFEGLGFGLTQSTTCIDQGASAMVAGKISSIRISK